MDYQSQQDFFAWETLSRDTIDFKTVYVDMADDLLAGLLLSQLIYWHLPKRDGSSRMRVSKEGNLWIAKTRTEWWAETRLKPRQVDRAGKILVKKGLVFTNRWRFNGSPTTHWRINWNAFLPSLKKEAERWKENCNSPKRKLQQTKALLTNDETVTSITETVAENVTQIDPPAQNSSLGESSQPKPQPNTNPSPQQPQATDPATPGDPADTQFVIGVKTPKPLVHIAVSGGIAIAPPACEPGAPGDTTTDAKDTLYIAIAPGDHPDDNIVRAQVVPGITAFEGFIPGNPGPDGILGPLATVTTADLLVGIGDFIPGIPGPDGDPGPDCILPPHAGGTSSVEPPVEPQAISPATSAPPAVPPRDYLTALFTYANRKQPGDSDTHIRPKHWQTVSDDEYAICRRVADLWCGGRLPYPGSIEAHCGAAGWLLHELNGGNLGACIRVLDEYHRYYEDEQMNFTVAGPKSLVAVLPAFLAQSGSGGEAGVIQVGG